MDAGFRAITGVEDVVGEMAVVVVGVSSWIRPGMAVDSCCIPRPLLGAFPPVVDERPAATPDSADRPDDVDVVGLERAPANESDVVEVVEVFAGAVVLDVVVFRVVESLV